MTHTLRIAPSILACDFARLGDELQRAEKAGSDWHHVDVMDGHFVPNLSIGIPVVEAVKSCATIPLDVHLMIEEPAKWAQPYADAGANILTFHYEAAKDDFASTLAAYKKTGCKVGVAVNPPCGVEGFRDHLDEIDMVLIMSVHAGFGGQSFMPEVLDKVKQLRDWGYDGDIEMDGGINDKTGADCAAAGTNCFVAGTYLYRADDFAAKLETLRTNAAAAAPQACNH